VPDVNDIVAVEAHRQLLEVKAGASIRAVKAQPSIWKEIAKRYVEEDQPDAYDEFTEKLKTTKMPLRNFGATLQDVADASEPEVKPLTAEEEAAEMERLLAESIENELKVTRTGNGAPKVDESGNVVPPIQTDPQSSATTEKKKVAPPVAAQQPVVVVKDDKKDK
jgi:hypothetical protein